MEKVCEFCKSLRPIVYCKADAAHLCLLCDVKVHSANTLSSRHPRALLCQVCKCRAAYVRCNDHNKFICSGCDLSLHKDMRQHQKTMVSSYMGSPSAKDFTFLWGFEMNKLENCGLEFPKYRFGKQFRGRVVKTGIESEVCPSSQHSEVYCKDSQNINTCTILQQIIELEKFQLSEANNSSSFIRDNQQVNVSSHIYDTSWKLDKCLPNHLSIGANSDQEMTMETFTTSFSPLEDLTSSSTAGDSLQGEPFWECERHDHDFEMWSDNIQEFGICEESALFDKSSIPDVDVSFRDFEEFFECDQNMDTALLDKKEMSTSSLENDISLCRGDHSYTKEIEDASAATCMDKDIGLPDQASKVYGNAGCSYPIRTSYAKMSLSLSEINARSNSTDHKGTGFSPLIVRPKEPTSNPFELNSAQVEGKGRTPRRSKDKKNAREYKKPSEEECREERANARKGGCGKLRMAKGSNP